LSGDRPASVQPLQLGVEDFLSNPSEDMVGSVPDLIQGSLDPPHPRRWRTVFERYLNAEFCLYVSLFKGPFGSTMQDTTPQYGAFLYWPTGMLLDVNERKRLRHFGEVAAICCQRSDGKVNRAVLVDIRQFLQMPQRTRISTFGGAVFPCEKRLFRFDQFHRGTVDLLQEILPPTSIEAVLGMEDRELRLRSWDGGTARQFPNDMIEGGSEVMDDLPDSNTPHRINGRMNFNLDGQFLSLRLELHRWSIRATIKKGVNISIQTVQLLPRTCAFKPNAR